jgi:hypothetical protein
MRDARAGAELGQRLAGAHLDSGDADMDAADSD